MKRYLADHSATDSLHLFAWRCILRANAAMYRWQIRLYRYQMYVIGEPSHRLMDLIADLEHQLALWEVELRYL